MLTGSVSYLLITKIVHKVKGDAVILLAGHRTCDLQVAGLSPSW